MPLLPVGHPDDCFCVPCLCSGAYVVDPECVAVGCGGDCEELREYPCNCSVCQGMPDEED